MFGFYGIGIWLLLIFKGCGFIIVIVGFLFIILYFVVIVGMLLWVKVVDCSGKKIVNLMSVCLLGVVGLGFFVVVDGFVMELLGISLVVVVVSLVWVIFWMILIRFLIGVVVVGGLVFINLIGMLGGWVGFVMVGVFK